VLLLSLEDNILLLLAGSLVMEGGFLLVMTWFSKEDRTMAASSADWGWG